MEPLGSWCRGNLKGRKRSLQQRCSTGCTVDAGEFLLLGKGFAGRRRIVGISGVRAIPLDDDLPKYRLWPDSDVRSFAC